MSYQRVKTVNFGRSRTGLATVAWSLNGGSTWFTTGVSEAPSGSGIYKATITFADGFAGTLSWKTGEGVNERYAAEEINPGDSDVATAVGNLPVGGGTLLEAIQAQSAVMAGKLTQSSDGLTDTFADFKDDSTARVTSVNSPTERAVTIH